MRMLLISLSKCESFSFHFSNANASHYHLHFGQQGSLPCAFVQNRHCSTGVTCGRMCKSDRIFGSVQIRPEKFINSWEWRICLPKTPAISNCVRILWGYVQIRHGFSRIKMCKTDKIFVTSIGGCVIVWVCGRSWESERNLGELRKEQHGRRATPDLLRFWGRVEKIWVNLRLEEIK